MIAISDIKDWIKIDRTVGIDGMKKIKLMASMELIKLLELVVPMKMEMECSTDLNGWTEGMEIMEQMVSIKSIEVMEPMELNV